MSDIKALRVQHGPCSGGLGIYSMPPVLIPGTHEHLPRGQKDNIRLFPDNACDCYWHTLSGKADALSGECPHVVHPFLLLID